MRACLKSAPAPPRYPSLYNFTRLQTSLHLPGTDLHLDWTVSTRLLNLTLEVCVHTCDLYVTDICGNDKDAGFDNYNGVDIVKVRLQTYVMTIVMALIERES